jgi:hypothetical protein
MPFWDRFVLWVYLALADTLPVGRDALGRLFDKAFALRRLNPAALNDLSILLIAAGARATSDVREGALAEITRRGLATDPAYVRSLLDALREHRLTEVLEINRPHRPVPAQLLCNVLTCPPPHEVWTNLHEFVARARFLDPNTPGLDTAVTGRLLEALRLYFERYPEQGTVDFLSLLYRHILGYLGGGRWTIPKDLPPNPDPDPPPWFRLLEPDEHTFLRRCWSEIDQPRVRTFFCYTSTAGCRRSGLPGRCASRITPGLPAW